MEQVLIGGLWECWCTRWWPGNLHLKQIMKMICLNQSFMMMFCIQSGSARKPFQYSKALCKKMWTKDLVVLRIMVEKRPSSITHSFVKSNGMTWKRARLNLLSSQKLWVLDTNTYDYLIYSLQKSKKEATNFDTEFTKEDPVLTPINTEIVKTINQVCSFLDQLEEKVF